MRIFKRKMPYFYEPFRKHGLVPSQLHEKHVQFCHVLLDSVRVVNDSLEFHRLSNREQYYTQLRLLRDNLNNVVGFIIIFFIHYWLVEWFCCYYRGITLHSLYETFHLLSWVRHNAVCCLQGGNYYLQHRNPLSIESLQLHNKQKLAFFPFA